jgi:F0F1-type ATP synthase membrane subunit b/b'
MKKAKASVPVKKVKQALGQRAGGVPASPADISESFRSARSSISDITADLQQLRRRAHSTVKRAQRSAKSK